MGGNSLGVSIRHSAMSDFRESSAPGGSFSKASGAERARRLISGRSPKQRQIKSGFKPMKE
jgi:hypothetical protein